MDATTAKRFRRNRFPIGGTNLLDQITGKARNMDEKVIIRATNDSNLLKAIVDYVQSEKIDYDIKSHISKIANNVTKIVYIDDDNSDFGDILEKIEDKSLSIVLICGKKKIIDSELNINYIVTDLINDTNKYTEVQNEYLFKKGIYHIFLEKLIELLENADNYDGMIYDLTALKPTPNNWIFSFDSINDTYSWLSKKNKMLPDNFVRKVINFYDDKIYNDSLREINYLTEKLMEIKDGRNIIDLFICNKDELNFFKKNYFFRLLVKNISPNYKLFLIDKDKLLKESKELVARLKDGIAIYDDCVYRDTFNDEFSLGYVDCNADTISEYNDYFDYILDNYGLEIKTESDLNEF